jgi:hypothetical protein
MVFANDFVGFGRLIMPRGYDDMFRRGRKLLHQEVSSSTKAPASQRAPTFSPASGGCCTTQILTPTRKSSSLLVYFRSGTNLSSAIAHTLAVFDIKKALDADGKEIDIEPKYRQGVLGYAEPFEVRVTTRSERHAELVRRFERENPLEQSDSINSIWFRRRAYHWFR